MYLSFSLYLSSSLSFCWSCFLMTPINFAGFRFGSEGQKALNPTQFVSESVNNQGRPRAARAAKNDLRLRNESKIKTTGNWDREVKMLRHWEVKFLDNFENLKIISDILCFGFCTLLRWLFFMTLGVKFHFFSRQKRVKLLSRLSQVTALQHREEHCPTTGKPNISPTGAKASGCTVEGWRKVKWGDLKAERKHLRDRMGSWWESIRLRTPRRKNGWSGYIVDRGAYVVDHGGYMLRGWC